MSASQEKSIVLELLQHYANLLQARRDAELWREQLTIKLQSTFERYVEQAEQQTKSLKRQASEEHKRTINNAEAAFRTDTSDAAEKISQVYRNLGIIAAGWDDVDAWERFTPLLMGDVLRKPNEVGTGVPSGIRVGVINETDVKNPLLKVPALAPLIGQRHIIITSRGGSKAKERALKLLRSVVTRVALTLPVMSVRFVLFDPLGLGDNFPFKRLPESIRGDTVYSEADEIRSQMRELTEHIRRVTLKYLASEYRDIESYNQEAEEVVEPYRFLCVADFPSKFDTDAATRLLSLAEKGVRTGVYLVMHINEDELGSNVLRDFNMDALLSEAQVLQVFEGSAKLKLHDLKGAAEEFLFTPDAIPESYYEVPKDKSKDSLFNQLLDGVSKQAERGAFQGIPFERIVVKESEQWHGDSKEIIDVAVGRSGARDPLNFWLGEKKDRGDRRISAHALVGGRTGYGKTTLFHTLICNLALKYAPDELEMYLLDYKEGVAFSVYAEYKLPHAKVIAIESERELGLSTMREIQKEMERRGVLFTDATKKAGYKIEDLPAYRKYTNEKLPRIVLIIDEFQVLFAESDMITSRASSLLDLFARQGRAFGIHVILGSQSVVVANIPKTTFGQFATRIVLRSPEAEVVALLGSDNVNAAELLERPGEVIYNDDGGRRDRNTPGQVAFIKDQVEDSMPPDVLSIPRVLERIEKLATDNPDRVSKRKQVIFRGNEGTHLNENAQLEQLYEFIKERCITPKAREIKDMFGLREWAAEEKPSMVWLGEATEIKAHTSIAFRRRQRSNFLIVGDAEEVIFGMIGSAFISLSAFYPTQKAEFYIIDLSLKEEEWEDTCEDFQAHFGSFHRIVVKERRGATDMIDQVKAILDARMSAYDEDMPSVFFFLAGLHRLSDMRPVPSSYGRDTPSDYSNKVLEILKRGPDFGIHTVMWVDSTKTFENYLGKPNLAPFGARAALHMAKEDSQYLLNEVTASTLKDKRAILLDDEQSTLLEKFKPYVLPSKRDERAEVFKQYAARLQSALNKKD